MIKLNNSGYGQLSQETWTFLHHIYDGGPVLFYEGEKDSKEKNKTSRMRRKTFNKGERAGR